MTIIDTDIIPITSVLDDKKSGGLDMSDSLFDYDLLLSDSTDTRNDAGINNNIITPSKDHDTLFSSLFHHENDEISDNSSNTLSPPQRNEIKRPRVMQWGPQDGHESSTIVSIVLEHTEETGPMQIVFGSMAVETAQQQHSIPSVSSDTQSVWITLAASVPPLSDTMSQSNQIKLSVCAFDPIDPDLAIDTWSIGKFTYRDSSEEVHNHRKRALSSEPDESIQKRTAYDLKQDGDVNSQLLKLLAPYDPLLTVSSENSTQSNLISNSQSATTWMSSPMDSQINFSQANSAPSSSSPFPTTNIMLQHGLVNSRPLPGNIYDMNHQNPYLTDMAPKQEVYRNYLEMHRQRQSQSYLMLQQNQFMDNYMIGNYNNQLNMSGSSNFTANTNYNDNNAIIYNVTRQENQNQHEKPTQQQRQRPVEQYTSINSRRSSAPVSSYSITNSNSCALNKAHLKLNGDLMDMIVNWSVPEWQSGRRLVQFWRHSNLGADGGVSLVECGFEPMDQQMYHQQRMRDNVAAVAAAAAAAVAVSNSPSSAVNLNTRNSRPTPIVISCIYWRERNDYFITSVDCIYLLESLIGIQFTVEEKNRIRRNLEGFRPLTVSKCKAECADFFKLIMSFPHPKPRNIEKDVKVFSWKTLPHALRKIIRKYTPSYITSTPLEPIQQHTNRSMSHNNIGNFPPNNMF